ncbi:MAG: ribose 5-phosphate isomerase B [Thermonemataceae bacterium]
MKIAIGCDHAGFAYKTAIIAQLQQKSIEIADLGTHSETSVDYPDFAHPVAEQVENHTADYGILICGSGNGVAMTANKHATIRAALCWNTELAALARQHNNANILCIPARFVDLTLAQEMVNRFLSTEFEGGRHERRVSKVSC